MPRRKHVPAYRLHKQSGQAVVTLSDGTGGRHDVLLGPHGSSQSRSEYARVIAEWEANGRTLPPRQSGPDLTVNELILRFWAHAEEHYRHADGTPTGELADYKLSLRPLKELYGHTPAKEFGPLALKAVRQRMIDQPITRKVKDKKTGKSRTIEVRRGLCRGVINQRIGRIRRMFRWAEENELVPPSVYHALMTVRGLQKGRSKARETRPVQPVPEPNIEAVLPVVLPPVRAMIELQLLTGMRPGEVTAMRACDLDMSGPVWIYRPESHKTEHHGHDRTVCLGPKAQEVIRPFLVLDTRAYLFSPRRAMEEYREVQRRNRKTKVQPSQRNRRKRKPKLQPRERYTSATYEHAVKRGCRKAGVPEWHPHRLRHNAATRLRKDFGLDVARAILGHRSPKITEIYAEVDTSKAIEVMRKIG